VVSLYFDNKAAVETQLGDNRRTAILDHATAMTSA